MFEVIGIVVVLWIVLKIIKSFFRGASIIRSQEYGKEARRIAIKELQVPETYYDYLTMNKIESIKDAAVLLSDSQAVFQRCSWPRILALVIYGEFHKDCQQWHYGNPISEQLLIDLGITSDIITHELERDPMKVVHAST